MDSLCPQSPRAKFCQGSPVTWWTFRGGGGVWGTRKGRGSDFFWMKIPEEGGGVPRRGGGGSREGLRREFLGGAKYSFRGRNSHQEMPFVKCLCSFAEAPYQVPPRSLLDAPRMPKKKSKEACLVPSQHKWWQTSLIFWGQKLRITKQRQKQI